MVDGFINFYGILLFMVSKELIAQVRDINIAHASSHVIARLKANAEILAHIFRNKDAFLSSEWVETGYVRLAFDVAKMDQFSAMTIIVALNELAYVIDDSCFVEDETGEDNPIDVFEMYVEYRG